MQPEGKEVRGGYFRGKIKKGGLSRPQSPPRKWR